jgi:hypothetical protein
MLFNLFLLEFLEEDPLSGSLFVCVNRRGNYVKLVSWDESGQRRTLLTATIEIRAQGVHSEVLFP